jgi:hypothetical protein
MKNIFYFIFTVLIIGCNNDKNINTTNESINLMDSIQKLNDSLLVENQNLKLSLYETKKALDNLTLNQVLDNKPNKSEEAEEDVNISEKNYTRKEVEEIVSEIRKLYNYRVKNLDCEDDMYGCKAEYNSSYFAPGCGHGSENINWFFSNDGEFNGITIFINTSLQLDCPSANNNKEYLLANTSYVTPWEIIENFKYFDTNVDLESSIIFYYNQESIDSERAYYYKNKLIKVILEDRDHNKEVYYYPFENLSPSKLEKLKCIEVPHEPSL